ncbi:MAG: thioredoxin fold domain-containing protein [Rhodospirillaceae bacterium]|nr:thioredoxin fold domain-containing protein [Rhodospirillaceae bacterium]
MKQAVARVGKFLILAILALLPARAMAAVDLLPLHGTNEDGIHIQPWINETFKDVVDDMETASNDGKRLLYIYVQQGCKSCKKMHEINFRYPQIVDYINKHFYVVQFNMRGVVTVTDIDGMEMGENEFSSRSAVNKTPTLQFFPTDLTAVNGQHGIKAEAYRFVGYQKPEIFLNQLAYIQGEHFKTEPNFIKWYQGASDLISLDPVNDKDLDAN